MEVGLLPGIHGKDAKLANEVCRRALKILKIYAAAIFGAMDVFRRSGSAVYNVCGSGRYRDVVG